MSKYRAIKTTIDGITFASKAESNVYQMRRLQERAGEISNLKLQPRFDIVVNGIKICTYVADFEYDLLTTGAHIVEDMKGVRTQVYRLKRKLMKAVHGIDVLETNRYGVPF